MVDKVTLTNVSTFVNDTTAVSTVNNNMAAITTAMDNTLSRDGTTPNQMGSNLDMNSNRLINLPAPTTGTEPARLQDITTVLPSSLGLTPISNNNILGNISGITALPIGLSVTNFETFLSSANNNAPRLTLINTAATSPALPSPFTGISGLINATASQTAGVGNAIVGIAINDTIGGNQPTGITGLGYLPATGSGSLVYGGFFPTMLNAIHGWIVGIETDCFNNSGLDAVWPLVGGVPNSIANAIGIQAVSNGPNKTSMAFRAIATGAPWLASFYADPPPATGNLYGIYIDSSSTIGPTNAALFRGVGSTPISILQVMGTASPSTVISQAIDASSNVFFQLSQSGAATFGNSVSNPGAFTNFIVTNAHVGTGNGAAVFAQSDAGSFRMQANSVADGSVGTLRWAGAGGILIDQLNATGSIQLRTQAGGVTAATVFSSGGFGVGSAATDPGAGNITLTGSLLHPTVANAAIATALTSVGPTGSHTTVQEWFPIKNASGVIRYVPGF